VPGRFDLSPAAGINPTSRAKCRNVFQTIGSRSREEPARRVCLSRSTCSAMATRSFLLQFAQAPTRTRRKKNAILSGAGRRAFDGRPMLGSRPFVENEGCQEPALRSGREAPSSSGRRRRRAARRTRRSVSIAPPKAGRGTECAGRSSHIRRLRRTTSGIVTRMGGDAARDGGQLRRECAALRVTTCLFGAHQYPPRKFADH